MVLRIVEVLPRALPCPTFRNAAVLATNTILHSRTLQKRQGKTSNQCNGTKLPSTLLRTEAKNFYLISHPCVIDIWSPRAPEGCSSTHSLSSGEESSKAFIADCAIFGSQKNWPELPVNMAMVRNHSCQSGSFAGSILAASSLLTNKRIVPKVHKEK